MTQLRRFLALALPMVVSRAGIAGMSIADGLMVARHGSGDLAALGLVEGTLGRLLDVLVALLAAGMVLAARARAADSPAEAGAVWRRAMALALLTGAGGMVAGAAGGWWLGWFGQAPELVAAAASVAAMLGVGIPAALVAIATAMFLEAVGRAPLVAAAVVAANALNIALNWLLIGGGFGMPALGALGSAISTAIVRVALAAALVAYAWALPDHAAFGIRQPLRRAWRSGGAQRRLGYGAAATAAAMNALVMSLTVFAGWIGIVPLAAIVALWNALSIGFLLALGVADATALQVAAAQGRRDGAALADGALGLGVTLATLAVLASVAMAAPEAVAGLYAPAGPLGAAMAALLPLGAVVMLCDGAGIVCSAALRGLGDVAWPTAVQIAVAIVLVPLAWWMAIGRGGGATGLVQAILLTSAVRAALLATRFLRIAGAERLRFHPLAS